MASNATVTELVRQARAAGYTVVRTEQLRTNRWMLLLNDVNAEPLLVLAQQRALISSADVHDLAELLRLQRYPKGFLLAVGGTFSAEARRTVGEIRPQTILLGTALPTTVDHTPRSAPRSLPETA